MLDSHIIGNIAQDLFAGKLSDHHCHELAPAVVGK
jgi:hypothetical protein